MRQFAAIAALVILAGACSSAPDYVATNEPVADAVATKEARPEIPVATEVFPPAATPSALPGTIPTAVPGTRPTALPGTRPVATASAATDATQSRYLLTPNDLPGWDYGRSMDFPAEPTFDASDCDLMNQAWAAHAQPGTRIRAGSDSVTVRQTVVEMADAASASAVLDAADRVWQECVLFTFNDTSSWVEPIETPDAGQWRSTAIAIGNNDAIWIIGYWQLDNRVVFVDIDGNSPWDTTDLIFRAVTGRLNGVPTPAPAPTPDIPMLTQASPAQDSLPTPTPWPTPLPRPTPNPGPDWREDPLASMIPDPSEIGPGWQIENGRVNEAEPGGDQEVPGCDLPSPVTPPGVEVTFGRDSGIELIEIQLMSGTPEDAAGWPHAFRTLVDCDISELGYKSLVAVPAEVDGADDVVVLDARIAFGDTTSESNAFDQAVPTRAWFGVASFDGLIIGVLWIDDADENEVTADEVIALLNLVASKR